MAVELAASFATEEAGKLAASYSENKVLMNRSPNSALVYFKGEEIMKSVFCMGALAMALLTAGIALAAEQQIVRQDELKTIQGPKETFTGEVLVQQLYPANNDMRSSGGKVTFQPGARSNWHIHPVGQVLLVTEGVGRTQEWGKSVQEVKAGDVIICPANVKHWHGASPNSPMTHISICEEKEPGKVVEWMEAVTDEQYNGK